MHTVNTFKRYPAITALACIAALGFYGMATPQACANEVISQTLSGVESSIDRADAQSRLPLLTDPSQLPPEVLKASEASNAEVESQDGGRSAHP